MSDEAGPSPPLDIAAEYALGILDADAMRAAEARAQSDPAFAAEALAWSERLSPLLDEIVPSPPSAVVWPRIKAAVQSPLRLAETSDFPGGAAQGSGAAVTGLTRSRDRWRWAAAGIAAAAAICLALLGAAVLRAPVPPPGLLVAELAAKGGASGVVAVYDPARRLVLLSLPGNAAPAGRSPELWLIDGSGRPVALGLGRPGETLTLTLTPALAQRVREREVFAVSIEPLGGSRTGQPTGPVVATGALRSA